MDASSSATVSYSVNATPNLNSVYGFYISAARVLDEERPLTDLQIYSRPLEKTVAMWIENFVEKPLKVLLGNYIAKLLVDKHFFV